MSACLPTPERSCTVSMIFAGNTQHQWAAVLLGGPLIAKLPPEQPVSGRAERVMVAISRRPRTCRPRRAGLGHIFTSRCSWSALCRGSCEMHQVIVVCKYSAAECLFAHPIGELYSLHDFCRQHSASDR